MTTKFTPGPWVASFGHLIRVNPYGSESCIAGVHRRGRYTGKQDEEQVIANAHLIAAAPDLFRLAEQYRNDMLYPHFDESHLTQRIKVIDEAIAKAKGRP